MKKFIELPVRQWECPNLESVMLTTSADKIVGVRQLADHNGIINGECEVSVQDGGIYKAVISYRDMIKKITE